MIEFALGIDGYPFNHEWCLYVLEAAPMALALTILAWYHPVKWMQQKTRVEFGTGLQDVGSKDARRPNPQVKGAAV